MPDLTTNPHDGRLVVTFDLTPTGRRIEGRHVVYPDALVFVADTYEDKRFAMSQDELQAAVAAFQPVSGNIEHMDFLKGRACQVRSVRVDEVDDNLLRGEVAVPLGLDELLSDRERKLSCEWDLVDKRLAGIALTTRPRIEEAALVAAFHDGRLDLDDDAAQFATGTTARWRVGAARDLPIADDDSWDGPAAQASVFSWAGWDDDKPDSGKARRAFLVYDAAAPKLKGSYKLPFAKVVGGTLKASRAGLRAAASQLPQTDIPDDVQKRARAVVDAYQKRIEKANMSAGPPSDADGTTAFADRIRLPEHDATMQRVHDLVATHDGVCPAPASNGRSAGRPSLPPLGGFPVPGMSHFGDTTEQFKALKKIHDLSAEHGATCPVSVPMSRNEKGMHPMDERESFFVQFSRWLRGQKPVAADPDNPNQPAAPSEGGTPPASIPVAPPPHRTTVSAPAASFADDPEAKRQATELAAQKAETERLKAETERLKAESAKFAEQLEEQRKRRVKAEAEAFAEFVYNKGHVKPPEVPGLIRDYLRNAEDDHKYPETVTFSSGGQEQTGTRVEAFKASVLARQPHGLFSEAIAANGQLPEGTQVLFNGAGGTPPPDPAARAKAQIDRYLASQGRRPAQAG